MTEDKKILEAKSHKALSVVMRDLGKLISHIEDLDDLVNRYRGQGVDASVRQFYQGSEFTRPLHHLQGLKSWQREYQDYEKRSA